MKFFAIMRPTHWAKNMFVFAALVFGKKLIGSREDVFIAVASAVGAFICFSLAASSVYIFNDIFDRKVDRLHREKCKRPIASGTVSIHQALFVCILCALLAIFSSFLLVPQFGVIILAYLILMTLYSLFLKNVMILDCVMIAVGFCLRAIAGAVVIGVYISSWLIICTFALCLFIAFGKRRTEIENLGSVSSEFRKTLAGYTPELLAHMLDVTSGLAIVCFLLYATDERTIALFGSNGLVYTTPIVLYCVFRFSALIQKGVYTGPVAIILRDLPFQIGLVIWVLTCSAIVYADKLNLSGSGFFGF